MSVEMRVSHCPVLTLQIALTLVGPDQTRPSLYQINCPVPDQRTFQRFYFLSDHHVGKLGLRIRARGLWASGRTL